MTEQDADYLIAGFKSFHMIGAGWVVDTIGWNWGPMLTVILAGLGLIVGLTGQKYAINSLQKRIYGMRPP